LPVTAVRSGDAVEVKDYVTQLQALIPLAGPANRQGRIAADNIAGRSSSFRGSQGTSVLGLFGMTLAGTGASEKTLKRTGRQYNKVPFLFGQIGLQHRHLCTV
jgi:NADPH-dependent 2,4-dienoyl-CoA reductase/sulfur reductase-like enzyme